LQDLIIKFLYRIIKFSESASSPALVIIDPKGLMTERIARLAIFQHKLRDHIVIVDMLERPALNLFDAKGQNPEQIISNFAYMFSITKQELTGKQLPCFSFCAELLFRFPGADLYTLLDLLDDRLDKHKPPDPRFAQAIASLTHPDDRAIRRFFEADYYTPNYASTRAEIKTRLQPTLKNKHLAAMLNAPERRLDIAECIDKRKIVLVNTRMTQHEDAHQILGRFMIALFMEAVLTRGTSHPAFLIIDEFQEFADQEKTPRMLRLMREYNAGAIIAHQNMHCDEFNESIRNAISTNTSIKFASNPGGSDISDMARDMRCEDDFLTSMCVKDDEKVWFGCYHAGLRHPFLYPVPFGDISQWPQMTNDQYQEMRANNKRRLAVATLNPPDQITDPSKTVEPKTREDPVSSGNAAEPVAPPANRANRDPHEPSAKLHG
jgi:hypothetical protein